MNYFVRWYILLSVFLCAFLTGCKKPLTIAEKEKIIYELFLKNEEKAIDNFISRIKSDSRTFNYDFPYLQNRFLQIIESNKNIYNQLIDSYTHYQWTGEKFTIINP